MPSGHPATSSRPRPSATLWRHIDELGLVACVHPSLGITGPDAISSGAFAERVSHRLGVPHTIAEPIAHMQDADLFVTSALFHGLLEDFPALRLAIVHAGTSWVPLALEKSETYLWLSPQFATAFVCLEPEEVWERHPLIVSFDSWEESVGDHARPARCEGGLGLALPEPRRRPVRRRHARCSRRTASTRQ